MPNQTFTPESPGQLATDMATWLKEVKDVEVTPWQVRAVLMYHSEFRRQGAQGREDERLRKAKERAERAAARVAELEAKASATPTGRTKRGA